MRKILAAGALSMVAPNISLFAEAKYLYFGSTSVSTSGSENSSTYTATYSTSTTGGPYQMGAAYHF